MPCILLVGKYPKPSDFPLTTYNTGQSDFAEVLREIFKIISYALLRRIEKEANVYLTVTNIWGFEPQDDWQHIWESL